MMHAPRKRAALAMGERMKKHLTTLCARCALFGLVLNVIEDDHGKPLYVATHWTITRSFQVFKRLRNGWTNSTKRQDETSQFPVLSG